MTLFYVRCLDAKGASNLEENEEYCVTAENETRYTILTKEGIERVYSKKRFVKIEDKLPESTPAKEPVDTDERLIKGYRCPAGKSYYKGIVKEGDIAELDDECDDTYRVRGTGHYFPVEVIKSDNWEPVYRNARRLDGIGDPKVSVVIDIDADKECQLVVSDEEDDDSIIAHYSITFVKRLLGKFQETTLLGETYCITSIRVGCSDGSEVTEADLERIIDAYEELQNKEKS